MKDATMERMDFMLLWFLVFSCFRGLPLPCCSAHELTCTVSQNSDHTTYNISDVPHDVEASSCEYTWANATQHVFANNNEKSPGLVMTNSISTLVTSKCFDDIIYTRSCLSEQESYTTKCRTKCSENEEDKDTHHCWIATVVVVLLLVLVLMILLGSLCYKFRDEAARICMVTAVENQNIDL